MRGSQGQAMYSCQTFGLVSSMKLNSFLISSQFFTSSRHGSQHSDQHRRGNLRICPGSYTGAYLLDVSLRFAPSRQLTRVVRISPWSSTEDATVLAFRRRRYFKLTCGVNFRAPLVKILARGAQKMDVFHVVMNVTEALCSQLWFVIPALRVVRGSDL